MSNFSMTLREQCLRESSHGFQQFSSAEQMLDYYNELPEENSYNHRRFEVKVFSPPKRKPNSPRELAITRGLR